MTIWPFDGDKLQRISKYWSHLESSDDTGVKLNINSKKITRMSPVAWNLNSTLINNPWTKERIKMKIRKYFELNNNENNHITLVGCSWNNIRERFIPSMHLLKKKKEKQSWFKLPSQVAWKRIANKT